MLYQPPTGGAANDPYIGANPGAGIAGSKVPPKAIEHHQRELIALITKSGGTPAEADLTQIAKAVRSQYLNFVQAIGGTAGAMTATLDPAPTAWSQLLGVPLRFVSTSINTAAPTLNLNGLGAKTIIWADGSAVAAAAWPSGALIELFFDGTNLRILSGVSQATDRFTNRQIITATGAGTFMPTTNGKHLVRLWAGGAGGGAGSGTGCAGGGGAGGYVEDYVTLTAGVSVSLSVGAGGAGSPTAGFNGSDGSNTTFGSLTANGGTGGFGAGVGGTGVGGSGGSGSGISSAGIIRPGGGGYQGSPQIAQSGEGGSGPAGGGRGGSASFATGDSGTAPAGAGSGSTNTQVGGAGARGEIIISW
jgi:hypothetical protein